jgi:hypothetical protein
MKKIIFTLVIFVAHFSISSNAHAQQLDAKSILTEVAAAVDELSPEKRMAYDEFLKQANSLLPGKMVDNSVSDEATLNKIGFSSQAPNPFVCVGLQGGMLAGGWSYKCVSSRLETFTISSFGVLLIAEVSANLVVGSVIGKVQSGLFPLTFTAGAYYNVGGTVIVGGGLLFLGAGVGMGTHLNYGVPEDSMFGGQLEVAVD